MYSADGFTAWLWIGPKKLRLYPPPAKKVKTDKREKPTAEEKKPSERRIGGDFETLKQYAGMAKDALHDVFAMLKIRWLRVDFTAASDSDPANAAILYGSAWSAAGIIVSHLENNNNVKKYSYDIQLDFTATRPTIYCETDVSFSVGRAVVLGVKYGARFLSLMNNQKKGRLQHGQANS